MSNRIKPSLPAWAILLAGLLLSVVTSLDIKRRIEQEAVDQFSFTCDQVVLKIQERLGAYALTLRGGAGLFAGSGTVDRHEWRAYVETLHANSTLPGVQGIGFVELIAPAQLAAHIARVRGEGFPDYDVHPSGERTVYTSIVYIEPFQDRNLRVFGFDMFSEPVRRAAMERARDSGDATLSGKVKLLQETSADVQAGTLMYVPVYRNGLPLDTVEKKRAALIGWVYSPYRMNDLMQGILDTWVRHEGKGISLEIYAGTEAVPAQLLFDNTAGARTLLYQTRRVDFNGTQWLLLLDNAAAAAQISYLPAWAALFGGMLVSGLVFGLMVALANTKARGTRLAEELTAEIREREKLLRESEFRWKFAIDGSGDGLWDWNVPDGTVLFSPRWKGMLGYAEDEIGNGLDEWEKRIHPDDKAATLAVVQEYLEGKTPAYLCEHRVLCKDGSYKWILDRGMVVARAEDGSPLRMIGTHQDVTVRKQLELERENALAEAKRFRDALDHVSSYVYMKDHQHRYVYANQPTLDLFGVTAAELPGSVDSRFFPPDTVQQLYEIDIRVLAGESTAEEVRVGADPASRRVYWEVKAPVYADAAQKEIWGLCGISTDISERIRLQEQARQLAFHDQLTGLPNRRLFSDRLGHALSSSKRSGNYGALMFLDLDNFKPLNDNYGHELGDQLLIEVAARLRQCVREMDSVARFGGDEFMVLLSELDTDLVKAAAHARQVAEKIRGALAEPYLLVTKHVDQPETKVEHHGSASIGIALFIGHETSQEAIIRYADEAMYLAKMKGRNAIRFYGAPD